MQDSQPVQTHATKATFPLFDAAGDRLDVGRQHGQQARDQIRGYLDFLQASLRLSATQLEQRATRFEPLFQRHCPDLLVEVRGLAEGACISYPSALALQLRGELGGLEDGGCTTFVLGPRATAAGRVLIGQTSDNPVELEDFSYGLRVAQGPHRMLMWTFGGMLGYHGMNSQGVAHFANSLGGGPAWRFNLSHYPLKRMILEQSSLADVLDLMRRVPVCSNGNYVLCDGQGRIADVELTSAGAFVFSEPDEGFLAHSNHFLCDAHACAENVALSLGDSFPRLDRMRQLIRPKLGAVTLADMQAALQDHAGHPTSICRHPHQGADHPVLPASGKTVSAIVAEPQAGRMLIARGNPCENPWTEWRL